MYVNHMENIDSLSHVEPLKIDVFHYIKQSHLLLSSPVTLESIEISRNCHAHDDGNKFSKMLIFASELTFYH